MLRTTFGFVIFILGLVILYAEAAFIELSFDPRAWNTFTRVVLVVLSIGLAVAVTDAVRGD